MPVWRGFTEAVDLEYQLAGPEELRRRQNSPYFRALTRILRVCRAEQHEAVRLALEASRQPCNAARGDLAAAFWVVQARR